MTNHDRVDRATIDEEETVAEEEFEVVQVSDETKPEVDDDEEGGGELGILMSNQEGFGQERGGGIAKSTLRFPVSRERRLAQPTW